MVFVTRAGLLKPVSPPVEWDLAIKGSMLHALQCGLLTFLPFLVVVHTITDVVQ